jgi:hypothetical protein
VHRPNARYAAAVSAAAITGLAVTAGGTALAGARAPAGHRAATAATFAATASATAPAAGRTVLTLPAGGRALASRGPDGPGSVTLLSPGRGRRPGGLTALRLGGQEYAIPQAALPYLGRGLDLSLFNVAALERAEHGGRVPVTLHYRGRLGTVPGVTVTRAGAGTAAGYLTAGSAARLGTGLAGLAGRGLSVRLAGGLAGPAAAPSASGGTGTRSGTGARTARVTVQGTGLNGRPTSDGIVLLGDVANSNARGTGLKPFTNGTAKFSGPHGTYWALAIFFSPGRAAHPWLRIDVLPQFKVAGNTTVRLSAAAATSQITLTSPRPSRAEYLGLTVVRTAPHAPANGLSAKVNSLMEMDAGAAMYASPVVRQPLYGGLRAFTSGQLLSPAGTRVPYAYTLDYANPPGTIAPQRFAATPASLATVRDRYFQDVRSTASWMTLGGTPWQLDRAFFGALATPLRVPGRQVQYLSGGTPTLWDSSYFAYQTIGRGQTPGGQTDTTRLVRGGEHLTQNWNEYPLHPAAEVTWPGNQFAYPSAVRQGNWLSLDMTPFSDNQPGHLGDGFDIPIPGKTSQVSGAYALIQNGLVIAHGSAVKTGGVVGARVSARPSRMQFVLSASRASTRYRLSPASVDEWTWRSRPEPGARVPAPWICPFGGARCAAQPLITLDYAVAGMGLTGTVPAGPQAITVTAAPAQPAAGPAVTSARAQVSLNAGRTWRRARVRALGHGRFRVTFTAPRSARVSLHVTARDAAGGSLSEYILRAYRTSA